MSTPVKTITFNTGRKYTAAGQVIIATLHDDRVVTFFDHSRSIDGEFYLNAGYDLCQSEVLHWYDSGNYKSTRRSWHDGMQQGGCNTRK